MNDAQRAVVEEHKEYLLRHLAYTKGRMADAQKELARLTNSYLEYADELEQLAKM